MGSTKPEREADMFWGVDLGLGACYSCLVDYAADKAAGRTPAPPRYAITYAPAAIPGPGPRPSLHLIPLPSCYEHLVPGSEAHLADGRRLVLPR